MSTTTLSSSSTTTTTTLTQLAEQALVLARRLDAYTAAKGLPSLSLHHNTLSSSCPDLPQELQDARHELADTAQMIKRFANDPVRNFMELMFSFADLASLNVIYQFNLPARIPLEPFTETVSILDIARASGMPTSLCKRVLVHAMENGIFRDAGDMQVGHSALSRLLATDGDAFQGVGMLLAELAPAAMNLPEAIRRFGSSGEPTETAYNLANETPLPIYRFLEEQPERRARFAQTMHFFSREHGFDLQHLLHGFAWAAIDRPGAVMVDIGGGVGTICRYLAAKTQHLQFIVQDLPAPIELGRQQLLQDPAECLKRVTFEVTDFLLQDQPVVAADVYFMRWILHNWSDAYCVQILRRLVPAMRPGSKVIIYEYILAEGPEFQWARKHGRNLDIIMHACWNGSERTLAELTRLFQLADERFVLDEESRPVGSSMSIVSYGWKESTSS